MCLLRGKTAGAAISAFLSWIIFIQALPFPITAQEIQQEDRPPFRIVVLEGEGSINNVKQPVNRGARCWWRTRIKIHWAGWP